MPRGVKIPFGTDSEGLQWRIAGTEIQIKKNGNWVTYREGEPPMTEDRAQLLLKLREPQGIAPPAPITGNPAMDEALQLDQAKIDALGTVVGEIGPVLCLECAKPRAECTCPEFVTNPEKISVTEGSGDVRADLGLPAAVHTDPVVTGDPVADAALAFKAATPEPAVAPPVGSVAGLMGAVAVPDASSIALLTDSVTVTIPQPAIDITNYFQVRPYGKDEVIVVRPVNGRMPRRDAVLFAAHLLFAAHGDLVEFERVFHAVRNQK